MTNYSTRKSHESLVHPTTKKSTTGLHTHHQTYLRLRMQNINPFLINPDQNNIRVRRLSRLLNLKERRPESRPLVDDLQELQLSFLDTHITRLLVFVQDALLPLGRARGFDQICRNQVLHVLDGSLNLLEVVITTSVQNQRRQFQRVVLGAPVEASKVLGQLLVEMENLVGVVVLARNRVDPEFLHEEDLVLSLDGGSTCKNLVT